MAQELIQSVKHSAMMTIQRKIMAWPYETHDHVSFGYSFATKKMFKIIIFCS